MFPSHDRRREKPIGDDDKTKIPPPSSQNIQDYKTSQERVHDFVLQRDSGGDKKFGGFTDKGTTVSELAYHLNQNKLGDDVQYITTEQLKKGRSRYKLDDEAVDVLQEDIDAKRTGTIYKKDKDGNISPYIMDGDSEDKILAAVNKAYGFPENISNYGYGQLDVRENMGDNFDALNDAQKNTIKTLMDRDWETISFIYCC